MQFLRAQIQSIAEQDNVNVSLFMADDGSTDGSIDAIESLKLTDSSKLKALRLVSD